MDSAPVTGPAPPASATIGGPIVQRLAAALGYRDFRVLWLGACTSSIGTWMQKVAQSWLVLDLTDSASYLALDAFLGELPILLFTLIGGVVADRRDRRALLLASQVVQMSSAFALAILVVGGWVQIWHVLALSFLSGCAQAFGGPAYQSLIPSLVHKDHLPNAVALNSIQFNIARVIGPLLAGVTLHSLGSASCFTVNGLSFLVVIAALLSLHTPHVAPAGQRRMLRRAADRAGIRARRAGHSHADGAGAGVDVSRRAAADVPAGVRAQRLSRRRRAVQPDDGVVRASARSPARWWWPGWGDSAAWARPRCACRCCSAC